MSNIARAESQTFFSLKAEVSHTGHWSLTSKKKRVVFFFIKSSFSRRPRPLGRVVPGSGEAAGLFFRGRLSAGSISL